MQIAHAVARTRGPSYSYAVDEDLFAEYGIFKATELIGDQVSPYDGARYGYIADLIVQVSALPSLLTDAGA